MSTAEPRIETYQRPWREHFSRLNMAWLEQDFTVEPIDRRVLSDPEGEIIALGGVVLFALIGDDVVGTCALKHHGMDDYELTKMAVDAAQRRRGIGRKLLDAAIARFHMLGGHSLWLESSSKLPDALHLYRQLGFVLQPGRRPGSEYARSDVYMVYQPR